MSCHSFLNHWSHITSTHGPIKIDLELICRKARENYAAPGRGARARAALWSGLHGKNQSM
jgi:hypothetical protein